LLAQSKRSLGHWILATFLWCLSCSSRRIARALGVHIRTSYRWCWWLRHAAVSYETDRHVEGTGSKPTNSIIQPAEGPSTPRREEIVGSPTPQRRKKREPGRGHDDKTGQR